MSFKIIPVFFMPVMVSEEIYKISKKEINYVKNLAVCKSRFNQTSKDTFLLNRPVLASLKKFILKAVDYYAYDFLKIKKASAQFYITQSWASYTNPGEKHHLHIHQNSLFSGVFYFQGEEGPIQFQTGERRFSLSFQYESMVLQNSETWLIGPQVGKLVLFPSSLRHEVLINKSSVQRISLSFNTFASGEFGETHRSDKLILSPPKTRK
jgi:uncharacterized protein (TIGR02466 family)